MFDWLRRLADPRGPLGEVVSPAIVFKERQGLPIAAPHTQRAPARFIAAADAIDVPIERVRQVSATLEEVWEPVYRPIDSTDLFTLLHTQPELLGWNVTTRALTRARRYLRDEEEERIQSLQVIPSDAYYNGIYETIPGNDPIVLDGEVLRGTPTYNPDGSIKHDGILRGTVITGGRAEYRRRTKGFVHWDKGFVAAREAAQAEMASRPVRNVRRALEATAARCLPTWQPVGINPRRDRTRAV
jgi:hypothetical protein